MKKMCVLSIILVPAILCVSCFGDFSKNTTTPNKTVHYDKADCEAVLERTRFAFRKTADWVIIVTADTSNGDKIGVVPFNLFGAPDPNQLNYSLNPGLKDGLRINKKGELFVKDKEKLFRSDQKMVTGVAVGSFKELYREIEFSVYLTSPSQLEGFLLDYLSTQR